jgi:3-hydroxyisobutyrate dehydrogenase
MVKDLAIALQVGEDIPAPFAELCRELWTSAADLLGAGQDHTAVARFSERLAGAELAPGRSVRG